MQKEKQDQGKRSRGRNIHGSRNQKLSRSIARSRSSKICMGSKRRGILQRKRSRRSIRSRKKKQNSKISRSSKRSSSCHTERRRNNNWTGSSKRSRSNKLQKEQEQKEE